MKTYREAVIDITDGIRESVGDVPVSEVRDFVNAIIHSRRTFVIGAGRSGLVGKAFAMRLMHLDLNVFVVGETVTPAINPGDLLIGISGSGKTVSVSNIVSKAKEKGSKIALITSYPSSPIAKMSDVVVTIKGREKSKQNGKSKDYDVRQIAGTSLTSTTPMGTLFELSTLIFLDSVVAELGTQFGKYESQMKAKHANLE